MAARQTLDDVDHYWGNDLAVSPTGDLARCNGPTRSEQHVLRRLLTNPGEYLVHTEYGGGLPKDVGSLIDKPHAYAKIKGQMLLEASVAQEPLPVVQINSIAFGISAMISYLVLPDGVPVTVSFDLER